MNNSPEFDKLEIVKQIKSHDDFIDRITAFKSLYKTQGMVS